MAEPSKRIPEFAFAVEGNRGQAVRLSISGHISLDNLVLFRSELESFLKRMAPASLAVDLAGVDYVDSAAALALMDLKGDAEALPIPFSFLHASEKTRGIMGLIDLEAIAIAPLRSEEPPPDFFTHLPISSSGNRPRKDGTSKTHGSAPTKDDHSLVPASPRPGSNGFILACGLRSWFG